MVIGSRLRDPEIEVPTQKVRFLAGKVADRSYVVRENVASNVVRESISCANRKAAILKLKKEESKPKTKEAEERSLKKVSGTLDQKLLIKHRCRQQVSLAEKRRHRLQEA